MIMYYYAFFSQSQELFLSFSPIFIFCVIFRQKCYLINKNDQLKNTGDSAKIFLIIFIIKKMIVTNKKLPETNCSDSLNSIQETFPLENAIIQKNNSRAGFPRSFMASWALKQCYCAGAMPQTKFTIPQKMRKVNLF